jgi:hypothetical protein
VNGGFFAKNHLVGTTLSEGMHTGKPMKRRPAVGWNNEGKFVTFGDGSANVGIRTATRFIPLMNFNTSPPEDENSLFTPNVIKVTPKIAKDATWIAVRNGVVTKPLESSLNGCAISAEGLFIVASGKARTWMKDLQPGSRVKIVTDWTTPAFANCTNLIQAGPMLIVGGKRVSEYGRYRANFLKKRHPRTIMGVNGEKLVWAVIDGRNPIHSVGATIEEAGRIAERLKLETAINLDGGGSSQMIWRDTITNLPSEGRERPLPYAILFHAGEETDVGSENRRSRH